MVEYSLQVPVEKGHWTRLACLFPSCRAWTEPLGPQARACCTHRATSHLCSGTELMDT